MRIAIFGEVIEESGRLVGAVQWARMVVALGMQPVVFLIGDANQYGRFREEFDELAPGSFAMFFDRKRAPNLEYLQGVFLNGEQQTPIADVALIVDHSGASFGIDLQHKLEEIGITWKARHYGDSFKRERGAWGEAIDCVSDIQDLITNASHRELVAA